LSILEFRHNGVPHGPIYPPRQNIPSTILVCPNSSAQWNDHSITHRIVKSTPKGIILLLTIVRSPLLPRRLHRLNNLLHHARVAQSANVAELVFLAREDLAQNSAHDLTRTRLGQIGDAEDRFRRGEGSDGFADLHDEGFAQLVILLVTVFDADESVDRLASELVVNAYHSSLADGVVLDQRGLDFGGRQAMAGDVDDVVYAAADPVVALGIAGSAVTSEVVAFVDVQVGVHVALVGAPDGAAHGGPGLLEGEDAFDVVAVDFLAGDGVDDRGLDAEEREGGGAGLGGCDAGEGCDDVGAGFGLPVGLGGVLVYVWNDFWDRSDSRQQRVRSPCR
jgi:hypothetical protein